VASVWPAIYTCRPFPTLATRLSVLAMPSFGLLASFGTWCSCGVLELLETGEAVVGLSALLHVVEAFLEAAPSSVIIWTALYQVGGRAEGAAASVLLTARWWRWWGWGWCGWGIGGGGGGGGGDEWGVAGERGGEGGVICHCRREQARAP
jgi:hypothetical protein